MSSITLYVNHKKTGMHISVALPEIISSFDHMSIKEEPILNLHNDRKNHRTTPRLFKQETAQCIFNCIFE